MKPAFTIQLLTFDYRPRPDRRRWTARAVTVQPGRQHAVAVAFAMFESMRLSLSDARRVYGRVDQEEGAGRVVLHIEQDTKYRCRYAVSPALAGLGWRDPVKSVRRRVSADLTGAVVPFATLLRSLSRRALPLDTAPGFTRADALDWLGV